MLCEPAGADFQEVWLVALAAAPHHSGKKIPTAPQKAPGWPPAGSRARSARSRDFRCLLTLQRAACEVPSGWKAVRIPYGIRAPGYQPARRGPQADSPPRWDGRKFRNEFRGDVGSRAPRPSSNRIRPRKAPAASRSLPRRPVAAGDRSRCAARNPTRTRLTANCCSRRARDLPLHPAPPSAASASRNATTTRRFGGFCAANCAGGPEAPHVQGSRAGVVALR